MATYNIDSAKHATLVATVVDTVNFSVYASAVRVTNRSGNPLYITSDGATPTVAGDNCGLVDTNDSRVFVVADPDNVQIKLVCALTAAYTAEAGPYS